MAGSDCEDMDKTGFSSMIKDAARSIAFDPKGGEKNVDGVSVQHSPYHPSGMVVVAKNKGKTMEGGGCYIVNPKK